MTSLSQQRSIVFDSDDDDDAIYEHNKARLTEKEQQATKLERRKTLADLDLKGSSTHDLEMSASEDELSEDDDTGIRHPYYNYATEKHDVSVY